MNYNKIKVSYVFLKTRKKYHNKRKCRNIFTYISEERQQVILQLNVLACSFFIDLIEIGF